MKKENRKKRKKIVRMMIFCASIVIFSYSTYNVCTYHLELRTSKHVNQDMIETAVKYIDISKAEALSKLESTDISEHAPISVDFESLQKEYENIVAWLYCPDTAISYPIVQGKDNSYFVHRLPNGQWNSSGSVFMDCRNSSDFSDFYTIIYGHHMKNGSMFGTLVKYKQQTYYDKHPVMYLLTPNKDYKVELVAGYVTSSNSEIYSLVKIKKEKEKFLKTAKEESTFESNSLFSIEDQYVVLSTCSYEYEDARYALIGKLVEIQKVE